MTASEKRSWTLLPALCVAPAQDLPQFNVCVQHPLHNSQGPRATLKRRALVQNRLVISR